MTTQQETFQRVLEHFSTAMLVTHGMDGLPRARPMFVAGTQPSGDLWFVTSADSGKVDELRLDRRVAATFQSSSRYLSISGHAEVVRDRAMIDALWSATWEAWFEKGRDDPSLCLIRMRAHEAEYWDNHGVKGLRYAASLLYSLLTGNTMTEPPPEHHGRVELYPGDMRA